MNQNPFAPQPWLVFYKKDWFQIIDSSTGESIDPSRHNLNLISAAPIMLDACKNALDDINQGSDIGAIKQLKNAISKAEGK